MASMTQSETGKVLATARFLRNAWYPALWGEELAVDVLKPITILGQPLVFFRKQNGAPAALMDRCAHRFAPLSMGKILPGDRVQCPYHGLEFGPSGACVHNPHGKGEISPANKVASFPVVEKHRILWVWMGDHPADESKIPDFKVLDTEEDFAIMKLDRILVKSNYELVTDNLLDLSHTSYLHDGILGNVEMVDSEISVKPEGEGIVVGRSSSNTPVPGLFAPLFPGHRTVDKWNTIRWTAPANMLLRSGVCEHKADPETGTGYYGVHLLCPETETTTHYMFTAVRWNILTDADASRAIREKLTTTRRFAFEDQDAPVIEAQQERLEAAGGSIVPVMLAIDAGPAQYKRILQRLLEKEQA
jgi:phenylpropionate dioxygenase-like ring-hydroxylating dioxygenase large terminal subunit